MINYARWTLHELEKNYKMCKGKEKKTNNERENEITQYENLENSSNVINTSLISLFILLLALQKLALFWALSKIQQICFKLKKSYKK